MNILNKILDYFRKDWFCIKCNHSWKKHIGDMHYDYDSSVSALSCSVCITKLEYTFQNKKGGWFTVDMYCATDTYKKLLEYFIHKRKTKGD